MAVKIFAALNAIRKHNEKTTFSLPEVNFDPIFDQLCRRLVYCVRYQKFGLDALFYVVKKRIAPAPVGKKIWRK